MLSKILVYSFVIFVVSLILPEYTVNIIGTIIGNIFFNNKRFANPHEKLFTTDELKFYNGVNKPELYLSILGHVFDVTKGVQHYGPNQQYNVFVGRDASKNFITGDFNPEDISEDVTGLTKDELRSLNQWVSFYTKEYKEIGKLIGKYYNSDGQETAFTKEIKNIIKSAEEEKENEKDNLKQFPPCNIEWDSERGTRLWCSNMSGGISRDWVGVPRKYYEATTKNYRCACIKQEQVHLLKNIKQYDKCDYMSDSCFVKN